MVNYDSLAGEHLVDSKGFGASERFRFRMEDAA